MKTNISNLMNIIAEEEKNLLDLNTSVKSHVINTTIMELNGKKNITEDYKEEFEEEYKKLEDSFKQIIRLKNILSEKNNEVKLSDGRSIQQAINENTYLRKLKTTYETFLTYKEKTTRISEYNDAYFECRTLNFKRAEIIEKIKNIQEKIQSTDFEIAKLNSEEFEY